MKILYKNLQGAFTGEGFFKKHGRLVQRGDATFVKGPLHILVNQNEILKIGSEILPADKVIDCAGLIATAAFIDSHTHALFGGSRWNEFFQRWAGEDYAAINLAGGGIRKTFRDTREASDEVLISQLRDTTQKMHAEGVRLVEVKSGYGESPEEELRILRLIQKAQETSAIEIISTFLGLHAIPAHTNEKAWTTEMIALLPQIKEESLAQFVDSFPEKGFFSPASTKEFSLAAQKLGFKIKIHADEITPLNSAKMGAEIGACSVDHLQMISDEALELLSKVPCIATLLPATSFFLGINYAPARKILNAGARVALATDYNPGTAPEPSLLFTAKLASSQMKLSPEEILCALTYNAAGALAQDSRYGLLKAGYTSQFLFWDLKTSHSLEEILLSGAKPLIL